jgi:hypothetical protein
VANNPNDQQDLANHVRVYTGRLFCDGSYTDEQRWVQAEFFEALRSRPAQPAADTIAKPQGSLVSNVVSRLRDLSNRLRDSGRYAADECDLAAASLIDEAIAALSAETSDEPSVMGSGCGIAPMPSPSEGIEAAVRLIQKICAEYDLDPAQWLHGEQIEALITERDEAVALAAMWHESCTGKHGSQAPCVSPPKTPARRTHDPEDIFEGYGECGLADPERLEAEQFPEGT